MTDRMQFRGYVFTHNPAMIEFGERNHIASHLCPGVGEIVQSLGPKARTALCKGSFGASSYQKAFSELEQFRKEASNGEAGMLYLPGFQPFLACLSEFSAEASGDGCIIPYTMMFTEYKA